MTWAILALIGVGMAIYKLNIKRKAQPNILASVVFTPASLDLLPGASGAVDVTGLDALLRPVAITVRSVSAPAGLTALALGNRVTVSADPIGPAVDAALQVDVDVV
jgi:hypothetical protein